MSVLFNALSRFAADRIGRKLRDRGWPIPDDADAGDILDRLKKLRDLLGSEDAVVESLEQPKVCGVPDCVTADARNPRWPKDSITYGIAHQMPGMTKEAWEHALAISFGTFGKVCGLSIDYTPNYKTAQIVVTVGNIDGSNGTLARAYLADGTMRQKSQEYDTSERWSMEPGGRGVYIPAVITHETGHSAGMPHLRQGALLQPTYDPRVTTLTQIDIDYLQNDLGYGKPKGDVPPLPTPDPIEPDLFVNLKPGQKIIVTRN